MGDLSKLKPGLVDFYIQQHAAERAGDHFDVRFGLPDTGLYSFATRKELPKPGERRALFQQPLHSHEYGTYEGEIPEGYGKGHVKKVRAGSILVTKVSPGAIHFTTADKRHSERFVMIQPEKWGEKDWLLINTTPMEPVPYEKVRYKKIPRQQVDKYIEQWQEGDTVETKIDGASSLIKLLENGVELVSYRASKETGRPIVHTEKFFDGAGNMPIPEELVGTVLKGELYGVRSDRGVRETAAPDESGREAPGDGGVDTRGGGYGNDIGDDDAAVGGSGKILQSPQRAGEEIIPPYELGRILNARLSTALHGKRERGIDLRNMVYDIQQLGKQPVDWHKTPRLERRQMIEQVLQHLPKDKFHISPSAETAEDATRLWKDIQAKGHTPATEGVVGWPVHGKPWKGKLVEDMDVHITGAYPGEGKYKDVGIGGFTYALEPDGPTAGRIGTGLTDQLRHDAFADPEAYVGRVARIQTQEQLPSGAYRAPAFMNFHEDYPLAKTAEELCPGCGEPFAEDEPYPDVDMCEVCERFGPPKKEAAEVSLKQTIDRATRRVREPMSPAQAEAGNYRKGRFMMHGLPISIETRKGQDRKGVDSSGNPWSNTMKNHYGYIRRTEGKDGDHVDVFVGGDPDTELIFIIDQMDPKTKRFDEHKCMCGFNTEDEAKSAYLANYEPGWKGFQGITSLTVDQFKEWLQHGNANKPVTEQTFALKTAADKDEDEGVVLIIQRHTSIQVLGPKKKSKKDKSSDKKVPEIDITIEVDGDDKAKPEIELETISA
jgi:hypothetical protein